MNDELNGDGARLRPPRLGMLWRSSDSRFSWSSPSPRRRLPFHRGREAADLGSR
jgi:hypothetical protein